MDWNIKERIVSWRSNLTSSEHSLDKFVDFLLSVAPDATFLIGMSLFSESFLWRVKLEWPEEVIGFLEVRSNSDDFVDEVFNTGNTVLSKLLFDNAVVSKRDSWSLDLSITSLVNELLDCGLWGVAVSNIRLYSSEHVNSGLVQFDEDSVVKLPQSQKLHDLSASRVKLVDTILSY